MESRKLTDVPMNRGTPWLLASGLMALTLGITACGILPTTSAYEPAPEEPVVSPPITLEQNQQNEPAAPPPDPLKYGGTVTFRIPGDPTNFDSGTNRSSGALGDVVYQQFMGPDWTRGPAGSKSNNFASGINAQEDILGPQIAESWQMPAIGVWKLKIRQGVHWQRVNSEAGRLVANRELTADDIVSGFNRLLNKDGKSPDSWILSSQATVAKAATANKTGPWEVTIKTPVDYLSSFLWLIQGSDFYRVYPPDVVAKYGSMANWHNAVGTGPYMLVDYVPGSQMIFARNPAYWETDPLGPGKGKGLPYPDELRQMIIPDLPTALAALRTGKLDLMTGVSLDDWKSLMEAAPKLEYLPYLSSEPWAIVMRQDNWDKPFSDLRVRQALMLATDYEFWKNEYYGGNAEIDVWPVSKEVKSLYQPLSQMPQSTQNLFKYNPDRAKQLLTEAGYPTGFKTSLVAPNDPERLKEIAVFKDMWAKIGIDLTNDVKQPFDYAKISGKARSFDNLLYLPLSGSYFSQISYSAIRGDNPSRTSDPSASELSDRIPFVETLYIETSKYFFNDWPKAHGIYKNIKPFLLENAFMIVRPTPFSYSVWWPWLKNYHGQGTSLIRYAWVDRGLKKSMGY